MARSDYDSSERLRDSAAPGNTIAHVLSRNWWVVGLRGAFAILFGVLALAWPGVTILTLVILFAAYMLADGVLAIVAGVRAVRRHERWWPFLLEGLANLAAGVIAILWPGITLLAMVYLLGIWAIVSGVLMAFPDFSGRRPVGSWLLVVGGVLSVILGVIVISQPIAGVLVLITWVAAYALAFGVILLILAFRLRQTGHAAPASNFAHRA
jgi:uncharacterized membrane protein HdeD (DUF308 family)